MSKKFFPALVVLASSLLPAFATAAAHQPENFKLSSARLILDRYDSHPVWFTGASWQTAWLIARTEYSTSGTVEFEEFDSANLTYRTTSIPVRVVIVDHGFLKRDSDQAGHEHSAFDKAAMTSTGMENHAASAIFGRYHGVGFGGGVYLNVGAYRLKKVNESIYLTDVENIWFTAGLQVNERDIEIAPYNRQPDEVIQVTRNAIDGFSTGSLLPSQLDRYILR